MTKINFISKKILDWDWSISGQSVCDPKPVKRAYELLNHSESLITDYSSSFELSDALSNLKRALNQRLKLIEKTYNLKSVKFYDCPKGYLELLEKYGLARPYLIKILMEIRNKIEHEDAEPPNINRCKELVDVTWYFLKSTDKIVNLKPTDIELEPKKSLKLSDKYGCTIGVKQSNNNSLSISGWFPKTYIYNHEKADSLRIKCSVIHDGLYWKGKEHHEDKTINDIWLVAEIDLDFNEKHLFLKKVFEAV